MAEGCDRFALGDRPCAFGADAGDDSPPGCAGVSGEDPDRRVVVGAYLASITISVPLTVAPLAGAAAIGGAGRDGVIATVVASLIGVIAYSALFVLLGLIVKNAIVWGLAYVLLWEGLFTQFSEAIGQAAVRGYLRATLADLSGVPLDDALDVSAVTAVVIAIAIAGFSTALAAMRLDSMEIA